jgi:hypothetical protein
MYNNQSSISSKEALIAKLVKLNSDLKQGIGIRLLTDSKLAKKEKCILEIEKLNDASTLINDFIKKLDGPIHKDDLSEIKVIKNKVQLRNRLNNIKDDLNKETMSGKKLFTLFLGFVSELNPIIE